MDEGSIGGVGRERGRERERERERVCERERECVCVRERERRAYLLQTIQKSHLDPFLLHHHRT